MGNFNTIKLSATTSTNEYLKQKRFNDDCQDGDLVWTTQQTEGRGRSTNVWVSSPQKSIAVSIYRLFDEDAPQFPFTISLAFSVAIIKALQKLGIPEIKIKWPNDILSCNQKIGGILIENKMKRGIVKDSIIGFGLNVNQESFSNLPNAASLFTMTQKMWDLDLVFNILIKEIEETLYSDFNQNHNTLLKEFNSYLWRKNIHSKFEGSKGLFKAIPLAVDSDGKLKIHNLDKAIEESIDLSQARMLYLDAKESS